MVTGVSRPIVLIVMDGWGERGEREGNAVALAQTPNIDGYLKKYPHTLLGAAGEDVGLPAGQMGNSEVGHLNLGAGRIVYQELTRISRAIREGTFFTNPVLTEAMAKARGQSLHLMGLLSDGGVHSHIEHLFAFLELAKRSGLGRVYVHAFLDGRDVPPACARRYLEELEKKCAELSIGEIATISGRYYAMDRDRRWERTALAYRALVHGQGETAPSAQAALEAAYARGETDEFVRPTVILRQDGTPRGRIEDGDVVIFFNFRPDRARQLTRALIEADFAGFDRGPRVPRVHFVCLTQYDETFAAPVAFPPEELRDTLGEYLAAKGLKQLRIAETEKYAHVTFFFSGGEEKPFPGEERRLIPSPKVATYDLKPEMSAYEVTDALLKELGEREYDLVVLNYANADMVGHTGSLEAAIRAVEAVDACVGRVVQAVLERGGAAIITADHGNAEEMIDPVTGEPHTAHTTNPVPFILVTPEPGRWGLRRGRLADVAPTILELLGLPRPEAMTGKSLLVRTDSEVKEGIK
ncbi:MAG: 2,3-bisphosphoglycerate-independent phosphoglycerate mutase [Bacillota bacterium]|nr:2,3-bisphosphoglycerate-independent phosphoglycerate mutase [Bacillota bacterium]MDK2926219.1 2,3-bisphosphoglycerate-independent phosphoglycerate mutase [Bacillota bacterium]